MGYEKLVKQTYKKWSKVYNTETNLIQIAVKRPMYMELATRKNEKILELGCGTGNHINTAV